MFVEKEVLIPTTGELFIQVETHRCGRYRHEFLKVSQVLCSDGVRRTAHVTRQPDTFFSIPAKVSVRGKTVSGYITRETLQGYSVASENDCAAWKFIAYTYGKNGDLLPRGSYRLPRGAYKLSEDGVVVQ